MASLSATQPRSLRLEPKTITWEQDYRERMNPALVTGLMQEAVPALQWVNWHVTRVDEGYAESTLPLNRQSTNQHGTHQAALVALAADYTGGTALSSLVTGTPVVGIHPQVDADGAALWLASMEIKYQNPSSGDLLIRSRVPTELWGRVRRRYADGQTVVQPLEIAFESNGLTIAEGTCVYMMKRASRLKPISPKTKLNPLYAHAGKATARLIAGMRARETASPTPLIRDEFAGAVAGKHGHLLAERFATLLPEMQQMVAARTRHLDDLAARMLAAGTRQFVFVGVGLDCRMYRLLAHEGCVVYELDLPEILDERRRALGEVSDLPRVDSYQIPVNFELEDLPEALLRCAPKPFDPREPALVVFEGVAMYLEPSSVDGALRQMHRLLAHPQSRLWMDIVSESSVTGRAAEALEFFEGMRRLGSPFVFGVDSPATFFRQRSYSVKSVAPSSQYNGDGPLASTFQHYYFVELAAAGD